MITGNRLYVEPQLLRFFGTAQEAELKRVLAAMERTTKIPFVSRVEELQLEPDGRLKGGYRYTRSAFQQICALICRGLYQTVIDLSGVQRTAAQPRDDYSFALAVQVFNRTAALRFKERIDGKVRLIRNVAAEHRLVEGALGPKYNYLENGTIFGLAKDAVATAAPNVLFREAALAGRRVLFRFVAREPLVRFESPSGLAVFHRGFHVANSELAGEASVRVAPVLLCEPTGAAAIAQARSGRLAHTGKDFGKKLGRLFAQALAVPMEPGRVRTRLDQLVATSLGLSGVSATREQRVADIVMRLHRAGVPNSLARRYVITAFQYGGGAGPGRTARGGLARAERRDRTAYDLFQVVTREALDLPLAVRETVEQAAYGLFQGHLRIS